MTDLPDWNVSDADLMDLTPDKARDMLIDCFYAARRQYFTERVEQVENPSEDDKMFGSSEEDVKALFLEAGADFDNPSKEVLQKVMLGIVDKISSWGPPTEVLDHYRKEMHRIVDQL